MRGNKTVNEMMRVVACVAIAALIAYLVPHVASFTRPAYDDTAAMPVLVRVPDASGAKRRMVVRLGELETLRAKHPDATLMLDTRQGRVALDPTGAADRIASYEVEEFPRGQIIALEVRDEGERIYASYRVEGRSITPISMRTIRSDETTFILLAGLVAALLLGRIGMRRSLRTAAA